MIALKIIRPINESNLYPESDLVNWIWIEIFDLYIQIRSEPVTPFL